MVSQLFGTKTGCNSWSLCQMPIPKETYTSTTDPSPLKVRLTIFPNNDWHYVQNLIKTLPIYIYRLVFLWRFFCRRLGYSLCTYDVRLLQSFCVFVPQWKSTQIKSDTIVITTLLIRPDHGMLVNQLGWIYYEVGIINECLKRIVKGRWNCRELDDRARCLLY